MSQDGPIHWESIDAPRGLRPGRRWIGWVIALAVVAGLVIFAALQADAIARDAAAGTVRSSVRSALQLPDTQEVNVDFGSGLFFLQALRGTVNEVNLTIPGVAFGEATADLELTGTGVPLESGGPLDSLTSRISVDEAGLYALGAYLSSAPLTGLAFSGENVLVSSDVDVAGTVTPVQAAFAPSTAGGRVLFTPVSVTAAGTEAPAAEVQAGPLAPFVGPLLTSPSWCAAQYLPKSLVVNGAAVSNGRFVVTAAGNGVPLTGTALGEKGVCEG